MQSMFFAQAAFDNDAALLRCSGRMTGEGACGQAGHTWPSCPLSRLPASNPHALRSRPIECGSPRAQAPSAAEVEQQSKDPHTCTGQRTGQHAAEGG
eukprot:358169-Chlamydomonas_euryale.AAC.2